MKLSLLERVIIHDILPKKSSFEKLIIISDIVAKVKITQEETEEFKISSVPNEKGGVAIKWNKEGDEAQFDIEFTEGESLLIAEILKKMSRAEELTKDHVGLYKLFLMSK